MKLKFFIFLVASLVFTPSTSWAYCNRSGNSDDCSDLNAARKALEKGDLEGYKDYLSYPAIFHGGKNIRSISKVERKKRPSDAKHFLKVAMPLAKAIPELAFYVGSVLRKGYWSLKGYRYGYGVEQHNIYRKQIEYFKISLAMKKKWDRETAAKILGNINYYGLLRAYANPYPYVVDVDYKKAAKFYAICGDGCFKNYIASVLKFDVRKGMSLLDKLGGFPEEKFNNDNYLQYSAAKFKYRHLWAIYNFGMYGVKKNEKKAKRYYSLLSKHTNTPLPFGNLETGEGLYKLYRMFEKDTVFRDGSVSPFLPESSEVELYLLHRSLEKKYTKAAEWLSIKYGDGRGVQKDFLRSYAYINIALGFASGESKKRKYEKWLDQIAFKRKLTKSQIIFSQQLSSEILSKLKRRRKPEQAGSKDSTGTGFYVSKKGHIVTNQHVIEGCKEIKIDDEGSLKQVSLIVKDVRNDIALLKGEEIDAIAFIRGGRGIRQGDEIIAYGYPLSGILSSTAKVTTGVVNSLSGMGDDFRYMQVSAPVQPGNSGGPLLDKGGNVVGIVTAKLNAMEVQKATGDIPQNINFALKSSVIKDLLDAHEINYETRAFGKNLQTSDIVAAAKKYTVRVQCVK
jgi:S1-C subfamily serine protease